MNLRFTIYDLRLRRLAGRFVFVGICIFAEQLHALTNELPALVPAYAELPPTFWEQHSLWQLALASALTGFALALVMQFFKAKPKPVPSPEKIARDALAQLHAQPEDGKLLSAVSQILRCYVGAVVNFPGGEMTTAEFCTAISQNEKIGTELSGAIASFLHECDVRKFSPANSTRPICAVTWALGLVLKISKKLETGATPAPR